MFINFGKIWERATGPVADIDRAPFGVHADVSLNGNPPFVVKGAITTKKPAFASLIFTAALSYRMGRGSDLK